jgi:RHS repeat-associated protein
MPGRKSSGGYRYGFNGMEKDDEVKGGGNSYTTLHRIYDPRLGRWLSVDPEADEYPDESPYAAMENNPISETDPDGDCPWCIAFIKGAAQEYATQVIMNVAEGKSIGDALTDVDGGEILKSAVIDGLTLGVGSLVSKAQTAVKVVKAADKIVDAEKAAVKANKVANTTEKVSKVEKNVAKAVNKNSNKYVGKQSVYEIKKDGKLVKYGKADATNVSKTTGQPKRLQTQVDKM